MICSLGQSLEPFQALLWLLVCFSVGMFAMPVVRNIALRSLRSGATALKMPSMDLSKKVEKMRSTHRNLRGLLARDLPSTDTELKS